MTKGLVENLEGRLLRPCDRGLKPLQQEELTLTLSLRIECVNVWLWLGPAVTQVGERATHPQSQLTLLSPSGTMWSEALR